jgi:glucose/arabinose dehydrogenase
MKIKQHNQKFHRRKKSIYFYIVASILVISGLLCSISCQSMNGDPIENLDKIKLPDGFDISYYAENVPGARSMALSDNGILYVGTRGRNDGKVYAVIDENGDYKADEVKTIINGKYMPNGVAFRNGDLYVAEVDTITRYDDIDNNLENPQSTVINDDYPSDRHHGWKYIAFGPDGKLYVPVGAPCNICDRMMISMEPSPESIRMVQASKYMLKGYATQ